MHQIRYFLAVSRTLNFTRAAEECHVAQPSLTRAIKLLEAELGGDLFRRERNLTHLTEFGERMLPLMRQCYESAIAAKGLASAMKSGTVVSLKIALSHTISMALLVEPLTELLRVFPTLELAFLRGTAAETAECIKKGEAMLAIAGPLDRSWERLDRWPLFSEAFQLITNASHELAAAERIGLADLCHYRLLVRPYCELAEPLAQIFRERELAWPGRHAMVSEQDVIELVAAGIGIGIVPTSTARGTSLNRRDIEGFEFTRTISLYSVAGRERPAPATALLKLLRARDWSPLLA